MNIGRIAKVIDNFKCRRFLSGNAIWIDRIHNREFAFAPELTHNSKRVVEISIDRDDLGAVGNCLNQFPAGNFAHRQDNYATNSGSCRISGR